MMIKIPATSANIGPGFDCLGVALALYNEFSFQFNTAETRQPQDLVYEAYDLFFKYTQLPYIPMSYTVKAAIPIARGLGSSSTCILAGLLAANSFYQAPLSTEELLWLATQLEGHPDNIVPAFLGGLTASSLQKDRIDYLKLPLSSKLNFIAFVPHYPLSTGDSRKVLPQKIEFKKAVQNNIHTLFLTDGLKTGNIEAIQNYLEDFYHEPYRSQLIPEYEFFKTYCGKLNIPMYLSGAGPTLMMIIDQEKTIAKSLIKTISESQKNGIMYALAVDFKGIQIEGV